MNLRIVFLTLLAVTGVTMAFAQTPTTGARTLALPAMGLGSTETAEVVVANYAGNSSSGTVASCAGSISFLNSSGTAIGSATAFTVTAGGTFSAKLPFSSSGGTAPRATIRGVVSVTVPAASTTSKPPCDLQVTFATFDTATGATHAFIGGGGVQMGGFGRP